MPRSRQVQGELPAPRGNETQTSHGRVVSVNFDRKKEGRDEAGKKQTVLTKIRSEVAVGMERPLHRGAQRPKAPPLSPPKSMSELCRRMDAKTRSPCQAQARDPCRKCFMPRSVCADASVSTLQLHRQKVGYSFRFSFPSCRPWAWNLLGHRTLLVFSFISNKYHTRQTANAAQQATNDPSLASSRRRPPQVILLPPSAPSSLAVASRPASRARRLKSPCRGLV